MKITFVLPTKGGGGGAHSVVQEMSELVSMGVDARVCVSQKHAPAFITNYHDLPLVTDRVDSFTDATDLSCLLNGNDLVICTIFTSVDLVHEALKMIQGKRPKIAYYIQDYEPLFVHPDNKLREQAFNSYTKFKDALLFAKTDWIRDIVTRNHSVPVSKVSPSLDNSIYYPSVSKPANRVWVTAMVRPSTARRAPRRTMNVLKRLREKFGRKLVINIFGCDEYELAELQAPMDFEFTNHGRLSRLQVGSLLRKTEIFMDLSDYQAFGRTGLEAMACGCSTVLPVFGGCHEYARHELNCFLVDTRSTEAILAAVERYLNLPEDQKKAMKHSAIETSQNYSIRRAAFSEYKIFQEFLAA